MAKRKKNDPLPDTMSGLIRVAMRDLAKAERTKKYKINMGAWHAADGKTCSVCYAGAVMAFSLKASPLSDVEPENWWNGIEQKLQALNSLREGDVHAAAQYLRFGGYRVPEDAVAAFWSVNNELCAIPEYGNSKKHRAAFHEAQRKLANALAKAGL